MYSNHFKDKTLTKTTFDELVEHHTNKAMTQLIEEGGKGLKSAVYHAMAMTIDWKSYQKQ